MVRRLSAVITVVGMCAFALPFFAHAQVPNVGAVGALSSSCPQLTVTLQRGSRSSQVTALQQFLAARYSVAQSTLVTGYFGPLTESYVKRFQTEQAISAIGIVGPQTRAAIARVCGGGASVPSSSSIAMTVSPISGASPLSVVFTIFASVNYCDSYILDYGDGQTENLSTICGTRTFPHTYATQGSFAAHLDRYVNNSGVLSRVQLAQSTIGVGAAVVPPAPTCTIGSSATSITSGQPITIMWSSANATSAKWEDNSSTGTSGSAIFNLTASTTKTITFQGGGGTKACSTTITVTPLPIGTIVASGNATANGSTATLPDGGQNAYKLAEFTLTAGSVEPVTLKKFVFTLRNQTAASAPGAATVSNYRVTIGTSSYTASVTTSGIYDTATVALGSGVTIAAKQSVIVGIFADVVPNQGGNLDLWIYPSDMTFTGNTTGSAVVPTSNVTNRVDTNLLYWSGWISVHLPTSDGSSVSGDCILDGVGYGVDPAGQCFDSATGAADASGKPIETMRSCPQTGSLMCTKNGWVGDGTQYRNNVKVACTSMNGTFVPGGWTVRGSECDQTYNGYANCEGFYKCLKNGWWVSDQAGNTTRKMSSPPWVDPHFADPAPMQISY